MIKEEIDRFLVNRDNYRYSRLGVVLCLMHIPYKFKSRYFCSQFVAEILEHAGAVRLKKKNTLYLPHQLLDGMECLFPGKKVLYGSFAVA
jgi:inositol transport system substrate-binding protein